MPTIDRLPLFEEIALAGKYYRLEWFGGVYPNWGDTSNPLMECFFTPYDPVSKQRLFQEQIRAGIAVGYLPSLCLGQVFNGSDWSPRLLRQETKITLQLAPQEDGEVTETTLLELSHASRFHPVHQRFLVANDELGSSPLNAGLKVLHGQVITGQQPVLVLIHEFELLRFYYATSTYLAKLIFAGNFGIPGWSERICNMLHEGPTYEFEGGVARFVYRLGFSHADVPVLARLLFEGGRRHALRGVRRAGKMVRTRLINSHGRKTLVHPRTCFPFEGKTTLALMGSQWKTDSGIVFLAHRILSCSGPFPFKNISFCEEVGPGGQSAGPDAPTAFPGAKRQPPSVPGGGEKVSVSTEPPSAFGEKHVFDGGGHNFLALQGMQIRREKRKENTHRSGGGFGGVSNSLSNLSTGDVTSGHSSSSPLSIRNNFWRPSAVPAHLDTFLAALEVVAKKRPEWQAQIIPAGLESWPDLQRNVMFSLFPVVPCEKRILQDRQFSFMDDGQNERRLLVCASLTVAEGQYVYLMEAQRRHRDTPSAEQSPYKDMMPIALIRAVNYAPIGDELFDVILVETVKKTTWPVNGDVPGIIRDDTRHGQGAKDIEDIAARMITLVQRHCPQ